MAEFIAYLPYYIITAPLAVGLIWGVITVILSPLIVTHNICEALVPTVETEVKEDMYPLVNRLFMGSTGTPATVEEFEMFSNLSKKAIIELSKTTKTYDPRYRIDDPLQFED